MICWEIDWRRLYDAFAPLSGEPHAHLLHAGDRLTLGWSTIVAFPVEIFSFRGDDAADWLGAVQACADHRTKTGAPPTEAPFHCGLVGYVGYEALISFEPSLDLPASPYELPDAVFGAYDAAAVFSRSSQRAYIVGTETKACERLRAALGTRNQPPPDLPKFSAMASNFTRAAYEAAVGDVIEKIRTGDFYQANIAQRLTAEAEAAFSSLDLFRLIAAESDASFGALLQYAGGDVISNSPERFFHQPPAFVSGSRIVVEPIKGTRGRAGDPSTDAALASALLADPKDRAENIMIADLMRNDLSKICDDHSIREEAICALMTLSRVHHLVSRISGNLRKETTVTDIFKALFPSGSITGAPKLEAMNAIAAVERTGRGPYCGAIGYIDDFGGADFSVAIRTLMTDRARRQIVAPVGGGVTLRSKPDEEYDETLVKAQSIAAALYPAGISHS